MTRWGSMQRKRKRMGPSLLGSSAHKFAFAGVPDAVKDGEPAGDGPERCIIALKRCMQVESRAWKRDAGMQMEMGNHAGPSRNPDKQECFMRIRIVGLLAAASLLLAFALLSSTPAAPHNTNVPATPAANALPATPAAATPAEPHPQIREALGALRGAKEHMEHAAHDFGGHRVEALKATDEAIRQLELCLKFDKD